MLEVTRSLHRLHASLLLVAATAWMACTDLRTKNPDPNDGGGGMDARVVGVPTAGTTPIPGGSGAAGSAGSTAGSSGSSAGSSGNSAGSSGNSAGSSADSGTPDAGPDAAAEVCTEEGLLRCAASNARQRERCELGAWTTLSPCSEQEVCDFESQTGCTPTDGICVGNENATTCVGTVLYTCGPDGTSTSQETCSSANHCSAGLASAKCPQCIQGEFRCTGTALESCVDGTFTGMQTCATTALCNAVVGGCTDAVCLANQFVCMGDKLTQCNAGQTALMDVRTCGAGLCDQTNGQCDECFASQVGCQNDARTSCTTDGQRLDVTPCGASTPRCVGQGRCVRCIGDGDCGGGGYCVNNACVTCRDANDCGTAECQSRACTNGSCVTSYTNGAKCQSTNVCTSSGDCIECRNNSDCVARANGTRVCLSAGTSNSRCVQCGSPADCPVAGACRTATCSSQGICGESIVTSGSCGAGKVCNPSGVCETACGNGRYDIGVETCDPTSSSFDVYTCDSMCRARTIYTKCGSGNPACVAPATCQTASGGAYCSPDCSGGATRCDVGIPPSTQSACFGTLCLIECNFDINCPAQMRCTGEGTYCEPR